MSSRNRNPQGLSQLFVMQRLLYEYVVSPKADKRYIPAFVRAWVELEERKRILRGKPLPGELLRAINDPVQMAKRLKDANRIAGGRKRIPAFTYVPAQEVQDVSCVPDTATGGMVSSNQDELTPQDTQAPDSEGEAGTGH